MTTVTFRIEGMHCDGCAARIRTLLGREPGIRTARVSFAEGAAEVRYNPHTLGVDRIRAIIEAGGFDVVGQTA